MKCLRKVNGSKIKSKMPIEHFLAQCDSEDHSDSFAVSALDLLLPPLTAADFPELPRAAPTPKMSKAEKAMAQKINTLLLSDIKGKGAPVTPVKPTPKTHAPSSAADRSSGKIPTHESAAPERAPTPVEAPVKTSTLGMIPIPVGIRTEVMDSSLQPSGTATPIGAMAALHAEHAVSCPHDTNACSLCRIGITCCKCHLMYTAPATKRMRCGRCLHWACDLDQSNSCCECSTPWIPIEVVKSPEEIGRAHV